MTKTVQTYLQCNFCERVFFFKQFLNERFCLIKVSVLIPASKNARFQTEHIGKKMNALLQCNLQFQ